VGFVTRASFCGTASKKARRNDPSEAPLRRQKGWLPLETKVTVNGFGRVLLRNLIVDEGDESKDVVATYSDSVRERIEQVVVIVLAAVIGVGASAVFGAFLGKVRA
jgi:hypothetical protein